MQALKISVNKDVCIFCLTRKHFASVHALRRPQRRLLSSTRAFQRPPASAVAQKEEDGVQDFDSAWRSPPSRALGGGWAKTRIAVPSDLTPEEKTFKNKLQKESLRALPMKHIPTSLKDGEKETVRGPRTHTHDTMGHEPRPPNGRTRGPPIEHTQQPSTSYHIHEWGRTEDATARATFRRMSRLNGRIPDSTPAEEPQEAPIVKRPDNNDNLQTLESRPVIPPRSESHTLQRPKFGRWTRSEIQTELTPQERALRTALKKASAPEPLLPVHRISHSPHISSIPGYPASPESQERQHVHSKETARASLVDSSSTQRQSMQGDSYTTRLPEYRETRNNQLDHHISESRVKPLLPKAGWSCSSCAQNIPWRTKFCPDCQTPSPPVTAQEPTEHAEHWKHVRRAGHNASLEHSRLEQPSTQVGSEDTQAIARARSIEQEKMERMERTKGGEFVGLQGKFENATSKAMRLSHWSFETDEYQVPDVESNTTNTPELSSTTGVGLVTWRSQPASNSQANEMQGVRDKGNGQDVTDRFSEDQPKRVKLAGGWKRWEPPAAEEQPPLEESSQHGRFNQSNASTQPSSTELERGWKRWEPPAAEGQPPLEESSQHGRFNQSGGSTQPSSTGLERERRLLVSTKERERHTRREPQGQDVLRHSFYPTTAMPYLRGKDRDRLRKSKKVVSVYDDEEDEDRAARRMERKEQQKKARAIKKAMAPATPIYLPEFISVSNLAGVLKVRVEDFIHKMKNLGFEETNNDHVLDAETAGLVAAEFNFEPIVEQAKDHDLLPRPPAEDKSALPPRPPVVTIMGHVDHGKTTLLDYLRKSSVAASEHGGITQHIGAFSVPMPGGRLVTFLDTPGHEAFLSMRQRGANVTDIVVLVVAADDSVKPQTIEAIRHAQAAKVPMIVAVNKIDKEDSNVERVKQDLARYGVEIEDYGGDTQVVCVSGKTGQGMEELEDAAVALADILDVRSETDGQVEGWVLEATTKKAGRVATVLVRRGTLRAGDIIVAGTSWARVRSLRNEAGTMLESAGPGTPAEIDGWRDQPAAGDEVLQAIDEQRAKAVIEHRLEAYERTQMATDMAAVNEARRLEQEKRDETERVAEIAEENPTATTPSSIEERSTPSTPSFQEVFFVIKADVSGSVEAVTDAVSALGNSEVRPHILRTGVGPVTEFDVDHAAVAKGQILSFNTTVDGNIQRMAEAKNVRIVDQSIIYRLVDDVKAQLSEKLPSIVTQKVLGEAEIAQVFMINTKGRITVPFAGCRVRNGVIGRNNKIRVLRGKEVVYDGTLSSLKNVKKDIVDTRKGNECGMGFEGWTDFKEGDQVQSYEETSEKRTL